MFKNTNKHPDHSFLLIRITKILSILYNFFPSFCILYVQEVRFQFNVYFYRQLLQKRTTLNFWTNSMQRKLVIPRSLVHFYRETFYKKKKYFWSPFYFKVKILRNWNSACSGEWNEKSITSQVKGRRHSKSEAKNRFSKNLLDPCIILEVTN